MKRKMLAVLVSVVMLCAMLPMGAMGVSAETYYYSGMYYQINNGEVTITGSVSGISGDLVIPTTIQGFPVTTIGNSAFSCRYYLTSITIPDSVVSLSAYAIENCDALETIYIGSGLSSIGKYALDNCDVLRTISVAEDNPYFTSMDGVLYTEDMTTLILYPNRRVCERYVVPERVTTVEVKAFWCAQISSIVLPSSLVTIGGSAFDVPMRYNGDPYLKNVYYAGNEMDRKNISGSSYVLEDATWHYAADPISTTVEHSVMDTEGGNGLAFRFELAADGVAMVKRTEADLTNATVNYLGTDCKLVGMGAVVTNSAAVGETAFTLDDVNGYDVLDVPTVYLMKADEDSCAFATRIINIPNEQLERVIYARPYYVVEVDGEEVVVYGDVDAASCAEYM